MSKVLAEMKLPVTPGWRVREAVDDAIRFAEDDADARKFLLEVAAESQNSLIALEKPSLLARLLF